MLKRISYEDLPALTQEHWMRRAVQHLSKSNISFTEDNREMIYYMTAIWLYQLDDYTIKSMTYPCYVVHCLEEDWRFVTDDRALAFGRFKAATKVKNVVLSSPENKRRMVTQNRVAMFHWSAPQRKEASVCTRLYSSDGYPFEKDYIPIGG